ncbi:Bacterial ribosome SSU maturation protein RimP [hydrothermal vent metagenome]|uniref:Bacterial ribosome SSU maturation protein RimP n=1 Tax=hydrothermal vent metagenome TaxID=652676 RepID=A0A3B1B8C1_9ZZZZ
MRGAPDNLTQLLRQVVETMGYELAGVELVNRKKSGVLLRIYIDNDNGITLDDCTAVSHQVSGVLDVEDPIKANYDLEVSSPGSDRPLFYKEHFVRFAGKKVRIKIRTMLHGQRRFEGVLAGMQDEDVVLDVGGEKVDLPYDQIETVRLVPEF